MPAFQSFQYRTFGAGSVVTLAASGGATLGGVWIATKGTTPTLAVYDALSSSKASAGARAILSTVITAVGKQDFPVFETGRGLVFKALSCTGTVFWRPGQAGGV